MISLLDKTKLSAMYSFNQVSSLGFFTGVYVRGEILQMGEVAG